MSAIIAGQVARSALAVAKEGRLALKQETDDFDFAGLIIKLFLFFTVAFVINKIFEAIIFGQNLLFQLFNLFGVNTPNQLPEAVVKFMQEGFHGIKYWDLVKIVAIILVVLEWYSLSQRRTLTPTTQGLFLVIGSGLALFTIPELFQRLKEMQILSNPVVGR